MQRILVSFYFLLFFVFSSLANDSIWLIQKEDTLKKIFQSIYETKNSITKNHLNKQAVSCFKDVLDDVISFNYPFDSLKHVGKLMSPDSLFRLITWNISDEMANQHYYGFIQFLDTIYYDTKVFELNDISNKNKKSDTGICTPDKWYGALYYDIIKVKRMNQVYYTILGVDYNNLFTSKKIIDALYFDKDNNPFFGLYVFQDKMELRKRFIFEYSARVVMSLKFDKGRNRIIFDHLSPREPKFEGNYEYYGPDFSFDAFELNTFGYWIYKQDIDNRRGQ